MPEIVGVKLKHSKIYYFSPNDIEFKEGDGVIVETSFGTEYGKVAVKNKEVDEIEIKEPLKPVLRKATEEDEKQLEKIAEKNKSAYETTLKKLEKADLGMKLVNVEYSFDMNKLTIYFTAEGRVDFRELVKELASTFRVRIELRQIYERDDIRQRGALAVCGRPCCCITRNGDAEKVSVKMAKMQGLSPNPAKISGNCGKLMCCLAYENDYYSSIYKKMPKNNSTVKTPDGDGTVCGLDMLKQQVKVKLGSEDGSIEIKTYNLEDLKVQSVQEEIKDSDITLEENDY